MREVSYQRPVKGKLVVRLDNGDEWDATAEDLERFAYDLRNEIYTRAERMLREGLGLEDDRSWPDGPNLVRYLIECAICYRHSPWANEDGEPWPRDDDEPSFKEQLRAVFSVPVAPPAPEEPTDG